MLTGKLKVLIYDNIKIPALSFEEEYGFDDKLLEFFENFNSLFSKG